MEIRDFVELGFLQEVNRQFLHRYGLALAVSKDNETGGYSFYGLQDATDDPEGWIFAIDETGEAVSSEKAMKVATYCKDEYRLAKFGWTVQPVDGSNS